MRQISETDISCLPSEQLHFSVRGAPPEPSVIRQHPQTFMKNILGG
ncbi:hypothetical protein BRYFOR_09743 [Marvinbryantia formatexigens DSM 14469]|uniref:Uncharacterized protein n=1 Tax=Marvinbryantia formatexigens DSM 14469 TaxID=478749 RepID=C6LM43_9FIRM|nr:hypothetical protein BRYFOR_09743 [Marvinbryantia formatexigens DSM 14469]